MHQEALTWLRHMRTLIGPRACVCDLGAFNVNGGAREIFGPAGALYIGVDIRPGPGVDVVADAAEFTIAPNVLFDLVVSTECLEHTANAEAICANAHRLLKRDGVFLVTAAGVGRAPNSVNGAALPEDEFYGNVAEADLRQWLRDFAVVLIQDRAGQDIYALAVKG